MQISDPMTRADRIREYRLRQPIEELERKADKAWRWHWDTQEGIDLRDARREDALLYHAPVLGTAWLTEGGGENYEI